MVFGFTSFNVKIINKSYRNNELVCKISHCIIYEQTPAQKNYKQVNKNTTINTARINVNRIHKQQYWNSDVYIFRDLDNANPQSLQEHSSASLRCHIKAKAKHTTAWVKIQSVLCEDAVCLRRVIMVWRSSLQRPVEQLSRNCYRI